MRSFKTFSIPLASLCLAALTACGGGGSGAAPIVPAPGVPAPTPIPGALTAPPPAPAAYADLYAQLSGDLGDFKNAVDGSWSGGEVPVDYAGQLTAANCNIGPALLSSLSAVDSQLDYLKALGVRAVSVEVSFPMLDASFLGSSQSEWVTFYANVAAAVRARGLKLIVESQSMIPTGLESTAWGPQLQSFYASLNFNDYVAARASTAAVVATTMQPDYFVLQEEPDTEAQQSGQLELETVAGSTTMLNATHAAVTGLVPNMKVGAGFGTWLAQYQLFANSFTQTACGANQPCVSTPLDFLDMHLFPINEHAIDCAPGVPCPAGSSNFWQNAMQIVATANAAHMHMTISQAWLRKVRDNEWLTLSGGGDIEEAREAYSFWAPLDEQFLQVLHDLANSQGMYFVAPFNTQNFAAYLTWSASTGIQGDCGNGPSPCGTQTPAQVFASVQTAALAAQQQGTYTSTGSYWRNLLLSSP